jgi:hypothetical protein
VNVTAKGDDDGPAPRCDAPYAVTGKARLRERVVAPVVFEDRLLSAQWGGRARKDAVVTKVTSVDGKLSVYEAWPAAKQPRQERMSRVCKVVGCAQGRVPRGANGEMLCTSSRLGVQEITRTIVTAKGDDNGSARWFPCT